MARRKKHEPIEEVTPVRDWSPATPEYLLKDQARLGYWRAVINGNSKRVAAALTAWSDLLRVKRTRKLNQ